MPRASIPVALAVAIFGLSLFRGAAFDVSVWAPLALLILALLVSERVASALPSLRPMGRWVLGLSAALVAWQFASMLWAGAPGAAWDAANLALFYLLAFRLGLSAGGDESTLRVLWMSALAVGAVVVGVTVGRAVAGETAMFISGRLEWPLGYVNGTAAAFALALWPALLAAESPARALPVRAGAMALATGSLALVFVTQSRGAVVALLVAGAMVIWLHRRRLRLLATTAVPLALVAIASSELLRPYREFQHKALTGRPAVEACGLAVLAIAAGAALIALVAIWSVRAVSPGPGLVRATRSAGMAILVLLVAGGIGAFVVAVHDPISWLNKRRLEFVRSDPRTENESVRYLSAGGQRYDIWRVAVKEFRETPFHGVGAGNFPYRYYQLRRTARNLSDPHGIVFKLGSELGLVGLLLALAATLVGIWSYVAWLRQADPVVATSSLALLGSAVTVLAGGLIDWILALPALGGLAMVLLGSGLSPPLSLRHPVPVRTAWSRVAETSVAVACAISLLLPFLSNDYLGKARRARATDLANAQKDAETARTLNPLSTEPLYLLAGIYEDRGRPAAAAAVLDDARGLARDSAVPLALLGDLQARHGRFAAARVSYRRALARNPLDIGLQQLAQTGGAPR